MRRIAICGALAGAMVWAVGAAADETAAVRAAVDCSVEERIAERYGRKGLAFVDDPKLPAERYEVRGVGPGRVALAGSTRRARLYGLGRHLRDAAFRGGSEPVKRIRGIYLATHFGNWYVTAPEREVCDYVEDLALWGCNQIRVWFDLHDYTGVDDPRARPAIDRLRAILKAARSCGIETSLIALSNESFSNSPTELRADWRGGKNGYTRDLCGHYHVEICPSKPDGHELILKNRAAALGLFKDIGIDEVSFFSYDQGGCTCADCAPWGGFGANPQPRRLAAAFRSRAAAQLAGFRPYSEGIYEDMNKVVALVLGWDPAVAVETALGDYAAFYFGGESRGPVTEAALLMEQNLDHTAYLVQDGRRWDTYQCGRIDAKRPFEIVAEARVDAARAAKALDLLKPFEAKLGASWRWRMLFLRAKIDRGLSLGHAVDGPELKPLFAELARIYRISDTTEPFLTPPGPMIDPARFHAGAL